MTPLSADQLAAVAGAMAEAGVATSGPLTATPIAGGRSNMTIRIEEARSAWVLRMPPRHGRTPSAHDVAREYRVCSALFASGAIPVARPVVLVDDDATFGAPYTVVEHVAGVAVRSRADLESLDDLDSTTRAVVEVLARLHRVDAASTGLESFGRPDGYAERQLRRWSGQWELVGTEAHADAAAGLVRRLAARLPRQASTGILHGDYRIDNVILDERGAVAAVVDWELSTLGDPVADVAMMCAYRNGAFDLVLGEPAAWTSPELPSIDGLANLYESSGGVPLVDFQQHLALACFKIAVIAAGIDHRHRVDRTDPDGGPSLAGEAVGSYLDLARTALG